MKIKESKLERYFARHEFSSPYLLCTSDCQSWTVEELFRLEENAEQNFKKMRLGYTESSGDPLLRQQIANLYETVEPEHVLVFAGAEEGIFVFMNEVLEAGDHIIVQYPAYQSLYGVADGIGCSVSRWAMDPENNWELDIDSLIRSINTKTRAIVVNFPNNPTGKTVTEQTYRQIADVAREHGLYLFSDEVYRDLEYDSGDRLPAGCDVYEKALSLGVMSKSFGLPGLRIGWLVSKDEELLARMAAFKDFTTICSSGPSEYLSILSLKHKGYILERNRQIIKSNLTKLKSFFKRYADAFKWVEPKAGPLIFPQLTFTEDAEPFCLDLLEKKGVLLVPGDSFNYRKNYVRIGFGRRNMPEALDRLEQYLKDI
jgi:aspartate/methionine/tyrosine aminotransferase